MRENKHEHDIRDDKCIKISKDSFLFTLTDRSKEIGLEINTRSRLFSRIDVKLTANSSHYLSRLFSYLNETSLIMVICLSTRTYISSSKRRKKEQGELQSISNRFSCLTFNHFHLIKLTQYKKKRKSIMIDDDSFLLLFLSIHIFIIASIYLCIESKKKQTNTETFYI